MINIITDKLPDALETDSGEFVFNTDFRVWLKIEKLLGDDDIAPDMKKIAVVKLAFEDAGYYSDALFYSAVWFYRCGEPIRETGGGVSRKVYAYDFDAPYIFAAFYRQYGIDLAETEMHWWKFRALFRGLKDTKFNDIVSWRSTDIDDDMTDSRKEFLYEMQELFELPKTLYEKQKIEKAKKFYEIGGG